MHDNRYWQLILSETKQVRERLSSKAIAWPYNENNEFFMAISEWFATTIFNFFFSMLLQEKAGSIDECDNKFGSILQCVQAGVRDLKKVLSDSSLTSRY